jgi:uncharacterized protein
MAKKKLECAPFECEAKCCRYVAIVIDTPRSKNEFENIRWFVSHENVFVSKDQDNDWLLEFMTPCKHLKNNLCAIYENRPEICRDYDPNDCERKHDGGYAKIRFSEPGEVEKFTAKRWGTVAKKTAKSKKSAVPRKKK